MEGMNQSRVDKPENVVIDTVDLELKSHSYNIVAEEKEDISQAKTQSDATENNSDEFGEELREKKDESSLQSPWAEAVLVIDFDERHGQIVQLAYPPDAVNMNRYTYISV